MHGVLFDLLEDVVTAHSGEDGWDDVLDRAGSDGVFTVGGWYADKEFLDLLAEARPDEAPADRLRWFAQEAVRLLPQRFPRWLRGRDGTVAVLSSLPDLLATELFSLHPSAVEPHLEVLHDPTSPQHVGLALPWGGEWCALVEGLVTGLADNFAERARVTHVRCVRAGSPSCLVLCDVSAVDRD